MFCLSFPSRQASKRLVAKLAAINAMKSTADLSAPENAAAVPSASSGAEAPAPVAAVSAIKLARTAVDEVPCGVIPPPKAGTAVKQIKKQADAIAATASTTTITTTRKKKIKSALKAKMTTVTADAATRTTPFTAAPVSTAETPERTLAQQQHPKSNTAETPESTVAQQQQQQVKKQKKQVGAVSSSKHEKRKTTKDGGEGRVAAVGCTSKPQVSSESVKGESAAAATTAAAATEGGGTGSGSSESVALQHKTQMVKSFRVEDVLAACAPNDGMFARRLPQGGCQFFTWPGTPLSVASNAVVTMPDTIRTVHAIFGREKTPVDLVLDIDCPVPEEHWSMSKIRPFQKKVLDDVMEVVVKEIEAIGEKIATQVVLQSPNLKKASFHVHTKLQDVAFEDYNSLHGFLHRFHKSIPTVDLQIFRPNGMLRMHRCMKENHTSAIVVFEDAQWNIGFPGGVVSDAVAALHSACIREAGTYSRLLHFDAPRAPMMHDELGGDGSGVAAAKQESRHLTVLLPRTEREAVENASRWIRTGSRETDVFEWRSWISLGISAYRIAHHFRDAPTLKRPAMEELLDAWIEASKKSPAKFRPGACESRWSSFDITRLSKGQKDWWPSYARVGRMAMLNEEADVAAKAAAASASSTPISSNTSK